MIPVKRKEEILSFIQQNRICTINELSQRFQVSRVTVHRVLNDLESEAMVTKVHGGVRVYETPAIETRFNVRLRTRSDQKAEIARKALRFIRPGDTVFIDSSTTCYHLALALREQPDLSITVISNGPLVSVEMARAPQVNFISTGGELQAEVFTLAGDLTLEAIERLQFDKAFISAAGLSVETGLMTAQSFLARIAGKLQEKGAELSLLIDSSKFGRTAPIPIMPVTRVARIVTDREAPEDLLERFRALGVEVVV